MSTKGTQIDHDKMLLKFPTYEDYLESLVTQSDFSFLRNTEICRRIAELGYRSTGVTLNRDDFEKRKNQAKNLLYPIWRPFTLDSELTGNFQNHLQVELALREHSNRSGILSTVIFIRKYTKLMFEISGYIDFTERLKTENFKDFFMSKKTLSPRPSDLIYYHWKKGLVKLNNTENFSIIVDSKKGLVLKNCFDRKFLYLNSDHHPGIDSTRLIIKCDGSPYQQIVIYDHVIRGQS